MTLFKRISPKTAIIFFLLFGLYFKGFGQGSGCSLDFPNDTIQIPCGDSVTLDPILGTQQIGDDFNSSSLDSGWSATSSEFYSQLSCLECPVNDGTPFFYMGPTVNQPRDLTTTQLNVECGGQICFDLIFCSEPNSNCPNENTTCEGPDAPDEGVALQYSIDNGTSWNTIFYFNPDTNNTGGQPPSPFVCWDNYCFNVPAAAQTDTTKFRFFQSFTSGIDYDHWALDNVFITGASCDSVLEFSYNGSPFDTTPDTTVAPAYDTDYYIEGISNNGDTCSTSIFVDVTDRTVLSLTPDSADINCTDTVQMQATDSNSVATSYTWTPAYNISDPNISNPQLWPYQDTTYTVVAHPGDPRCGDTASAFFTVVFDTCYAPEPIIERPVCRGDSNASVIAKIIGCRGPYRLTLYDSNGVGVAQDSPTTFRDTITGLPSGPYTLATTDTAGCTKDTSFVIPAVPKLNVSTSSDTIVCEGGTATISAFGSGGNGGPYTYDWDNGLGSGSTHQVSPGSKTTYAVRVEDPKGCYSEYDSITVDYYPGLFVTASNDQSICFGGSADLSIVTANGGSGSGYSFVWTKGNDTVGTGPNVTVTPNTPSTYTVHLTDDCETPEATDQVNIDFYPDFDQYDMVSFIPDDTAGCYPHTVQFTNTTPDTMVQSSYWEFGDGQTSTDKYQTTHTYSEPGCYDVKLEVTSPDGCTGDTTIKNVVCAHDYPVADFDMEPNPANVLDPEIFFQNTSVDNVDDRWTFPVYDSTMNTYEPVVTFPDDEPGRYEVELLVTNKHGCQDSITQTAIIEGVYHLYVPNAFTPNGDGVNDIFRPTGEGVDPDNYELRIYNRWGKLIYSTKDPTKGWDGTVNGNKVKNGVYVWEVRTKDIYKNREHLHRGHINVVR